MAANNNSRAAMRGLCLVPSVYVIIETLNGKRQNGSQSLSQRERIMQIAYTSKSSRELRHVLCNILIET